MRGDERGDDPRGGKTAQDGSRPRAGVVTLAERERDWGGSSCAVRNPPRYARAQAPCDRSPWLRKLYIIASARPMCHAYICHVCYCICEHGATACLTPTTTTSTIHVMARVSLSGPLWPSLALSGPLCPSLSLSPPPSSSPSYSALPTPEPPLTRRAGPNGHDGHPHARHPALPAHRRSYCFASVCRLALCGNRDGGRRTCMHTKLGLVEPRRVTRDFLPPAASPSFKQPCNSMYCTTGST